MKIQINRYDQSVNANPNLLQGQQIKLPPKSADTLGFIADTLGSIKQDYDKAAINEAKADFQKQSQNKMMEIQTKYKGLNASPDKIKGEYNKWLDEYKSGWDKSDSGRYLTSDQQKSMNDFITTNSVAVNNSMNYYSMGELEKAKQLNYENSKNASIQAIASANQIDNINIYGGQLYETINNQWGAYGEEVVKQKYFEAFSDANYLNIASLSIANPSAAIDRYVALEGNLSQDRRKDLQAKLMSSFIDTESQRQAEAQVYGTGDYVPYINPAFASKFDDGHLKGADVIRRKVDEKAVELIPSLEKKKRQNQVIAESNILVPMSDIYNSGQSIQEQQNSLASVYSTGMSVISPEWINKFTNIPSEIANDEAARANPSLREKQEEKEIDSYNYSQHILSSIQNGTIQTLDDIGSSFDWNRLTGKDKANILSELGKKSAVDKLLGNNQNISNNINQYIKAKKSLSDEKLKMLPRYNQIRYLIVKEAQNMSDGGILNLENVASATEKVLDNIDSNWTKTGSDILKIKDRQTDVQLSTDLKVKKALNYFESILNYNSEEPQWSKRQ